MYWIGWATLLGRMTLTPQVISSDFRFSFKLELQQTEITFVLQVNQALHYCQQRLIVMDSQPIYLMVELLGTMT
jgi:hypothetical protein